MSATVTARGTGTHNSSATTFTLSPSGSLAAGSMAVLVVSADNAHANGDAFTTFNVSDDQGNLWTRRVSPLYDPAGVSAGVEGGQFTTDMAGGTITSATVITVTFDTATTAKAWVMWEVIPDAVATKAITFIASGVNAGSATAAPTVTTSSITSGDVVIGALHNEYGTEQTVTADADASNGSWSAQQASEVGSTTTGINTAAQAKVTSGTATQTYNPTMGTSSDVILSWIQLRQIPFLKVGAVDQTAYVLLESLSLRFNTFDFSLKNPATIPANGDAVTLGGPPYWTGTVVSVETIDYRSDYKRVNLTATNTDVGTASAAPFGLSDAPNNSTTFMFRDMSVRVQTNIDDATETTTGSCTTTQAGLWPAMTFTITSANRGYAAQSFSVTDTTVTWPTLSAPLFRVSFGDPIVTMSVWVASQAANAPAGSIDGTRITDGSIDTPQLHANAVTTAILAADAVIANVINAGGTVTIDSTGITITEGVLTFEDNYGVTALDGGGFGATWRRFITAGIYNSDFAGLPPTAANNIDNSANILPSWTWTDASGTHVKAKSTADASAGSGRVLRFTVTAGAAGDEAYIEQSIPINSARSRSFTYRATCYFFNESHSASNLEAYINHQYLQDDGTTTTGASSENAYIFDSSTPVDAVSSSGTTAPSDAYYLRIRVGVRRGAAANGTTGTIDVSEVRLVIGTAELYLTDASDPTLSPGRIRQDNGRMVIWPALGGGAVVIGGRLANGSNTFPGSPATDDLFYRTDFGMWFYYDGTRWLSATIYHMVIDVNGGTLPISATNTGLARSIAPLLSGGASDIYLLTHYVSFFVSGGTALGASHKWIGLLKKEHGASVQTTVDTVNIDSGASDTWRTYGGSVNALMNNGTTEAELSLGWTKTGTPGNLYVVAAISYRLVAT